MENVYFILKNGSKLEQLDQCDGMCSSIIVTPIRELPFEPELTADIDPLCSTRCLICALKEQQELRYQQPGACNHHDVTAWFIYVFKTLRPTVFVFQKFSRGSRIPPRSNRNYKQQHLFRFEFGWFVPAHRCL